MRSGYYKGAEMSRIVVPLVMSALLLVVSPPSIQCASYQTEPNNPCALSETEPNIDDLMEQVKNFASANNTALANMVGYLYFPDKGYLPMVLSKFDVDEKKAVLASECATLTWNYDASERTVHLLDLELEVPTEDVISGGNGSQHTCRINNCRFSLPTGVRFWCYANMRGRCHSKEGNSLVKIVISSLELELLGDPSKISEGKFSSFQPAYRSCSLLG